MKELNKMIEIMANEGKIFNGTNINPKRSDMSLIGPLHPVYYSSFSSLDYDSTEVEKVVVERRCPVTEDVNTSKFINPVKVSRETAEEMCRCNFENVGFKTAHMLEDENGVNVIEVVTDYGTVMPITYPHKESLCGIFTNSEGETAYVMTGRAKVVGGRIYIPSINQEALDKFVEARLSGRRVRLSKIFSEQLWQLGDEEEETETKDKKEKAIMWLVSCRYGKFPIMKNGEYYNTVWNEQIGVPFNDIVKTTNLSKYIRYSSLSQNGVTAQAGPIECIDGNYVVNPVKTFNGTKGKLDISATRGPKQYKQSGYKGRVLIALCAPTKQGEVIPVNCMGNVITTKEAYDSYVSDFTRDLASERKCQYPAHKIFIETKDEVVRVKGAASFEDMYAVLENGNTEEKVILLPPVELNIKGELEEDLDKFKYLCKVRDNDSELQMVTVFIFGKKYVVPALYCDVYEDAEHSALSTSSIKEQNLFYYGGIMALYQMNGRKELMRAIKSMLDHKSLNNVLNCIGENKTYIEENTLSDFIKQIK